MSFLDKQKVAIPDIVPECASAGSTLFAIKSELSILEMTFVLKTSAYSMITEILSSDGMIQECEIQPSNTPPWTINVSWNSGKRFMFEGDDLFEALIAFRIELEKTSRKLLCMGARVDVFPSGMGRQMSGGRKAYILRPRIRAKSKDLVDIFEPAKANEVGTVAQQKTNHKLWIREIMDE